MDWEKIVTIAGLLGVLVAAYFEIKSAGRKAAELEALKKKNQADEVRREYLESLRKKSEAARDSGSDGAIFDSHSMSDAEYKQVFGFDRPHSNS